MYLRRIVMALLTAAVFVLGSAELLNAQQTTPPATPPATTTDTDDNDDADWGWIGILGLIGLAGLAGLRRGAPTRTTTRTGA